MACGEADVGVAVHVGHGARFRGPVRGGVLDDAEGVNPEMGDGHGAGGGDGVDESLWEGEEGDAGGEEGGVGRFEELDGLEGAPAV